MFGLDDNKATSWRGVNSGDTGMGGTKSPMASSLRLRSRMRDFCLGEYYRATDLACGDVVGTIANAASNSHNAVDGDVLLVCLAIASHRWPAGNWNLGVHQCVSSRLGCSSRLDERRRYRGNRQLGDSDSMSIRALFAIVRLRRFDAARCLVNAATVCSSTVVILLRHRIGTMGSSGDSLAKGRLPDSELRGVLVLAGRGIGFVLVPFDAT